MVYHNIFLIMQQAKPYATHYSDELRKNAKYHVRSPTLLLQVDAFHA